MIWIYELIIAQGMQKMSKFELFSTQMYIVKILENYPTNCQ